MRTQSDRQAANGGWLHTLTGDLFPSHKPPPPPPPALTLNASATFHAMLADTPPTSITALAEALCVSLRSLHALQAAWSDTHKAFAFPMRGGDNHITGIRLRTHDGHKFAVKGSKEGIFIPQPLEPTHTLFICEGPTDTAAALTMGLPAIGRPSCAGAVTQTTDLCRRLHIRNVVIIADADPPHKRPDGSIWFPGRDGAKALAAALHIPWKLFMPPAKDIRAWLAAGATREDIDAITNAQLWRMPQ